MPHGMESLWDIKISWHGSTSLFNRLCSNRLIFNTSDILLRFLLLPSCCRTKVWGYVGEEYKSIKACSDARRLPGVLAFLQKKEISNERK